MEKKLWVVSMKKNCRNLIRKNITEKVIKKKGNKLYVKSKGYNNYFNSCIDKKDLIKSVSTFNHIEALEETLK